MPDSRAANAGAVEIPSVAADPRWSLAQRIACSQTFCKSARLSNFLLYVCECAVSGREDEINEQQIGIHVFGRTAGYNSNEDSIVRSQARLLRTRLDAYFQNEGSHEALAIQIPKGSYVPRFELRTDPIPAPLENRKVSAVADTRRKWQLRLIAGAALAVALSAAGLAIRFQLSRTPSSVFWTQVFEGIRPTLIVPSDTALVFIQGFAHKQVDLKAYLSRSYLQNTGNFRTEVGGQRYTGVADLNFFSRLTHLTAFNPDRIVIRYARDLQVADLRGSNLILVGARRANPWVELFDQKNNFQGLYSEDRGDFILNRAPKTGEQNFYANESRPEGDRMYGLVSFVPGITGEESVLVVGGTHTPGTEGASNFVFSRAFDDFLATRVGSTAKRRHFEILLRMGTFNGSAQRTEVVSYRLHDD